MEFAGFFFAAMFVEGFVQYAFKPYVPSKFIAWIALLVGILFSIAYHLDLLAMFGFTAFTPVVGYIVTGLIIGRGSNYVNDLISLATPKQQ